MHATFPGANSTIPFCQSILALFVAYLYQHNYASSTVQSYLSAIGYLHKLAGFPDPSKSFLMVQILKGYGKVGARQDSRLPITPAILNRLMHASDTFCVSPHKRALFQAMCALAFHAFLRVGEITVTNHPGTPAPLQLHQCLIMVDESQRAVSIKLTFLDYKHSYNKAPFSIVIKRQPGTCPVQLMLEYLKYRGSSPGCLFLGMDGGPVKRNDFCDQLALAFKFCGLDTKFYKGHSFRIGAASHAAEQGLSDAQIRVLGRWKSNAFRKYIRLSSAST